MLFSLRSLKSKFRDKISAVCTRDVIYSTNFMVMMVSRVFVTLWMSLCSKGGSVVPNR